MEDTFAQIDGAAEHSLGDVNVSITSGGSIIGQGVTASSNAVSVCGGNLDSILQSFGGVDGGDSSFGGKAAHVVNKTSAYGSKLNNHLEKQLTHVHEQASDLEAFASMAKSAAKHLGESGEAKAALEKIIAHVDEAARSIRGSVDKEVSAPKRSVSDFIERNGQFVRAIKSLGANLNETTMAGMLSLSFTSVNELKKIANEVSSAMKTVGLKKSEFFGSSLSQLDRDLTEKLARESKQLSTAEMKEFLAAWQTLMKAHGHKSELATMVGGQSTTDRLVDRLTQSRNALKTMVNKFIDAFAVNINGMVRDAEGMAVEFGKRVDYDEHTIEFLDAFKSLNEYLANDTRKRKLYQYLLELNQDTEVDSKEVKERFLSTMSLLAQRANAMDSMSSTRGFAQHCNGVIETVNKFNDMIKTHRDDMRKQGGSTESMNELFSIDAAKIDITGLMNPLESLSLVIQKIEFYRNIAIFRSNLSQTNGELATYSKDYATSVGKAIGQAITKIKNEYTDIINQVSDNKVGMGLEIDMYNESAPAGEKISKEKLKIIYKWQCDARMGLYKTIEAIDMYLLHFTETVTKNPDAVADLHKMLSATKIISKWYDTKAGDNLIRMFEAFNDVVDVDAPGFISSYATNPVVNISAEAALGDHANKIYERSRRAVEGVVVLKNIISYFITISEKYGDFRAEKNIYMAPSNIYKNLVNYVWVSALDVNTTGNEILTDNNETKRLLTYEDTKARLAQCSRIDPTTMGINFNKHSIDKLRIMKCHNDLLRLKDFTADMAPNDIKRLKQYVTSVFARVGATKYIFPMALFGVYDLSRMDRPMVVDFLNYLLTNKTRTAAKIAVTVGVMGAATRPIELTFANIANIATRVVATQANTRGRDIAISISYGGNANQRNQSFLSLTKFLEIDDTLNNSNLVNLNGMVGLLTPDTPIDTSLPADLSARARPEGFLSGFLSGLTNNSSTMAQITYAQRAIAVLHYCVMQMVDAYKREQTSSVFAIDDTYFILTIKAIAGKIMAVTGVNSIFKRPTAMRNAFARNETRLILGGMAGDSDIIDEAVELYVRLPLLAEFYRRIFDQGNKDAKNDVIIDGLDEERVAFVPEVGNVWSGLLINVFDKSKHIDSGLYTPENMVKIIAEINSIYKHFKGSVPADQLTRHIMTQLVAEVNRRYGIIKRQELQEYYRVVKATKTTDLEVSETQYTNNDLDILDESLEFEEKAPSDAFIKFRATIADPSTPVESKINKLTDYRILKDFRERINDQMVAGEGAAVPAAGGRSVLSIVDRVRALKKAVTLKSSKTEKYDMIIKAIEESSAMDQSSNDIYMCFHELVLVPMRTAQQMFRALDLFILNVFAIVSMSGNTVNGWGEVRDHPVMQTPVKLGAGEVPLIDAIRALVDQRRSELVAPGASRSMLIGGPAGNTVMTAQSGSNLSIAGVAPRTGHFQTLLMNALLQFVTNSGELVKMDINTTKRITVDLSEYQKVCEHLVANAKYMVDKFVGLVPSQLIDRVMNRDAITVNGVAQTNNHGIGYLESEMLRKMFNKANKSEKERDLVCIDNLYKVMPVVSDIIFKRAIDADVMMTRLVLQPTTGVTVSARAAMPVIRDSFMVYRAADKAFVSDSASPFELSSLLFNSANGQHIGTARESGLIQEFNTLIANYMNDLYDAQSRKIYTKTFANFAGSALIDALNGQSFPDFSDVAGGVPANYYTLPSTQTVLSSTIAYAMKIMSNRVNPITGMKIHEVASLQEISPHVMEKYRSLIPMYLRIFKAFLTRCKVYRKMIGNSTVTDSPLPANYGVGAPSTNAKDTTTDAAIPFAAPVTVFGNVAAGRMTGADARDMACLYIDEIVNGLTSLVQDATAVQKELLENDPTVSLYFDVKRDFTKNYFMSNKEYPFAPLSILAMGFKQQGVVPLYGTDINNNKFVYGLRCMLSDDFKLTTTKVPYLKRLVGEFNGYTTKTSNITEAKFNDVLQYVSRAANYLYDLRFFNGIAVSRCDIMAQSAFTPPATPIMTFQESRPVASAMTLIESVNSLDSRNKIADYVKAEAGNLLGPDASAPLNANGAVDTNPRARVIMVNILDLNIVPINVHSLMREIPLANLYNYAMTFDNTVRTLPIQTQWQSLLIRPYAKIELNGTGTGVNVDLAQVSFDDLTTNEGLRFVGDVLFTKLLQRNAGTNTSALNKARFDERAGSKIFHNLLFLSLIQYAIKAKVKSELEFINTRVVSNTNAVNDMITDAMVDRDGVQTQVTDGLFEF